VIDEEVSKLIELQYQRALKILTENKDKLSLLADKLLTSEVIFKEDLIEIFGKRPWEVEEEPVAEKPVAEIAQTEEKAVDEENVEKEQKSEEDVPKDQESTEQTEERTEE
jgi:cell division protease FtsH